MIIINVSEEIRSVCPQFVGAALEMEGVVNSKFSGSLWSEIRAIQQITINTLSTEMIKFLPAIESTRAVYRACGKDPSRYRPAAEALLRRTLQGKDLYQIDTLVDLINLASMQSGYSIGGFDADNIVGDCLTLGIGKEGEPYEGIGRGMLNIAGLPVYRDREGGIGTPTSDHERTKITASTKHILVLVNGYDGNREQVVATAELIKRLVCEHAAGNEASITVY